MTVLAVIVMLVGFVLALLSDFRIQAGERKLKETQPWELEAEKTRALLEFWYGTRIVTTALTVVSGGYLMWICFIQPTLPFTPL